MSKFIAGMVAGALVLQVLHASLSHAETQAPFDRQLAEKLVRAEEQQVEQLCGLRDAVRELKR
jgi:hypothetical protein